MPKDNIVTALGFVATAQDLMRAANSDSLIEFTKATRVEPIVLLDDRVLNLSFTPDVLQTLTSIFAGYYLQAVSLSVNVGKVDVIKILDKLNPNRDPHLNAGGVINSSLRGALESLESYKYGLPVPGEAVGLECFGLSNTPSTEDANAIKIIQETNNLAVGKLINVEIESDGQKASFPVGIRLVPTSAPSAAIVHILTVGSKNLSVSERWHQFKAGQIEFIKDFILMQDLIDDHKKGILKDTTGIYQQSLARNKKNKLSAIFSGNPSVATASNIIVIAEATRKELEREMGGKLSNFKVREKMFKETYTMIFVVIDPDWEAVTIYHRSIESPTEVSASDMKNPKKGNDIGDILKAYTLGNAPSF